MHVLHLESFASEFGLRNRDEPVRRAWTRLGPFCLQRAWINDHPDSESEGV